MTPFTCGTPGMNSTLIVAATEDCPSVPPPDATDGTQAFQRFNIRECRSNHSAARLVSVTGQLWFFIERTCGFC